MIGVLQIGYHLDEKTYGALYEKYELSKGNQTKYFSGNAITEASFLDIAYQEWGRICFFGVKLDVNRLYGITDGLVSSELIEYNSFYALLTKAYVKTFGQEVTDAILAAEQNRCDYVEYVTHMKINNAGALMKKLSAGKFSKEQLDSHSFHSYRLKSAYVTFTINQLDSDTLRVCAKCPNTVLKRIHKVEGLSGVTIEQVFDKETAADILFKQIVKYTKPDIPEELSREAILASL